MYCVNHYDLAMVRAFVQVYETGSVREASEKLFVTQPAVSYSLGKLRRIFGDELFVRRGHRMHPTEKASALYPRLRQALQSLEDVMGQEPVFEPAASSRTFTLQLTDLAVHGLLPRILRVTQHYAPHLRIRVQPLQLSRVAEDLFHERADAAILSGALVAPQIRQDLLFAQDYVGVCSPRHPRIGTAPTLGEYLAERHVVFSHESGHDGIPRRIEALGHRLEVAVDVPSFMVLPNVLADTHFLAYAPRITAENFEAEGKVRIFDLPFAVPPSEASLYTLKRTPESPPHAWLRHVIRFALAGGTPEPRQAQPGFPPPDAFLAGADDDGGRPGADGQPAGPGVSPPRPRGPGPRPAAAPAPGQG